MARQYVLPLLVIDECGPRVSELATAVVGDLDEERRSGLYAGASRLSTTSK